MIHYKINPQLDFAAVLDLYASVGWSNYTNRPQQLEQAFHQSLSVMAAYDEDKLVALIRVVGDGLTIVFIQDLFFDSFFSIINSYCLCSGKSLLTFLSKGNVLTKFYLITEAFHPA